MSRRKENKRGNDHEHQGDQKSGQTAGSKGLSSQHSTEQVNVNEAERHFSMICGTALVVCGLLRGSLSGLALAALGGALIYRGHTGHCHMYQALDHSSADDGKLGESYGPHERHDEGSEAHKIHAHI